MYPSIEMVKDLSKSYRRVPVCTTMLSDPYTPVELLRILRKSSRHCYLLESASQDEQWGRYSFLGYDPTMEITCTNGYLTIRKIEQDEIAEHHVRHPHTILRDILKRYHSPILDEMPPFTGGLVGYFAYDYIKYGEPKLHLDDGQSDFKDMDLMVFDSVIALDHYQQRIYLITGVDTGDVESSYQNAQKRLNAMKTLLKQNDKKEFPPIKLQSKLTPKFNRSEFCSLVEDAKHYIYEGDIFQVVLSNPMQAKATGSLFDTYRILRASNPSPYMFYLSSDDIELVGASPETLVKLENKKLFTFPLAGTRPRGKNKDEDLKLEKELLSDEKERAEHNMLVDLGRNDIGKISELGTVTVDTYMEIERFSNVMHIGSTVSGTIRKDLDALDAIDSILPAGTLSGAPKFRACEIIQELENCKRGVYGGAIGYIDFAGNLDACIAIRLVYKKNGTITVQSGAGIVSDSIGDNEFMETRHKARAVIDAIEQAEGGLE